MIEEEEKKAWCRVDPNSGPLENEAVALTSSPPPLPVVVAQRTVGFMCTQSATRASRRRNSKPGWGGGGVALKITSSFSLSPCFSIIVSPDKCPPLTMNHCLAMWPTPDQSSVRALHHHCDAFLHLQYRASSLHVH